MQVWVPFARFVTSQGALVLKISLGRALTKLTYGPSTNVTSGGPPIYIVWGPPLISNVLRLSGALHHNFDSLRVPCHENAMVGPSSSGAFHECHHRGPSNKYYSCDIQAIGALQHAFDSDAGFGALRNVFDSDTGFGALRNVFELLKGPCIKN